jgi:hypothetical protein
VTILSPIAGTAVTTPIKVHGQVSTGDPPRLAAQVQSREPDGSTRWRGNVALESNGSAFGGDVPFVIDEDSPGLIEVLALDEGGGVVGRAQVDILLTATEMEP